MAFRRLSLVTIDGSGSASSRVAHDGTMIGTYENALGKLVAPEGVATEIATVEPTAPEGATALICVGDKTDTLDAAALPKVTCGFPKNAVPVIVTAEPPAAAPVFGVTVVIVGAP
jgi:hypothetical protein